MKCGKCKKEGVTLKHVRKCYASDILEPEDYANWSEERKQERALRKRNRQTEAKRKRDLKRKRQKGERERAEERKAAAQEADRLRSAWQKTMAENYRQREESRCKDCESVPDINGRCRCST